VPHAFQQWLSGEKTPMLCEAIPSFDAMIHVWREQQCKYPGLATIIAVGLDKLQSYHEHTELVPTYVLTMGT
ncbi:hypothetical protein NEOLEDRAFT_1025474, partial [Neolentinus lepideus HHB14362 ss-1]